MPEFRLLIMRHGQAESYSPEGDSGRRLTAEGRAQVQQIARPLHRLTPIHSAVASPFVRAQQTAEIVCEPHQAAQGFEIETWAGLTPSSPPQATVEHLLSLGRALPAGATLAAFGHNPNVTTVLSILVAGRADAYFSVRPGDAALLIVPEAMPFRPRGAEGPLAILDGFYPLESLVMLTKSP